MKPVLNNFTGPVLPFLTLLSEWHIASLKLAKLRAFILWKFTKNRNLPLGRGLRVDCYQYVIGYTTYELKLFGIFKKN